MCVLRHSSGLERECSLLLAGYAEHGLSSFVDILDAVGGCTSQELMDVAESSLIMLLYALYLASVIYP